MLYHCCSVHQPGRSSSILPRLPQITARSATKCFECPGATETTCTHTGTVGLLSFGIQQSTSVYKQAVSFRLNCCFALNTRHFFVMRSTPNRPYYALRSTSSVQWYCFNWHSAYTNCQYSKTSPRPHKLPETSSGCILVVLPFTQKLFFFISFFLYILSLWTYFSLSFSFCLSFFLLSS